MYSVSDETRKPIFEGVQGENEAREIQFDISPWVEELGEGVCTATAKRPTDTTPYPVTVTRSGNVVTWKPNSTDTSIEGIGAFQLSFSIDSVVAKTRIWNTKVAPSLVGAGDPPGPYDDWIQDLREIAAETLINAQNAEDSAENAEAWAVGQRGGVDVPSTDPTYENNAKYWAEQSLANQYGAYIVKSASGDIASFADGGDDIPMKSLKVTITPKQAGSGDPSPSNVRPITGTSTAEVYVRGVNLWDEVWELGKLDLSTGANSNSSTNMRSKNYIPIPEGQNFYNLDPTGNADIRFCYYDINKNFLGAGGWSAAGVRIPITGTRYIRFFCGSAAGTTYQNNISINIPTTDHEYHPYAGTTTPVPLGQTVYGGEVDVTTGVLTINRIMVSGWTQFNQNNGYKAYRADNLPKGQGYNLQNEPMCNMINEYGAFSSGSMDRNIIQVPNTNATNAFMALDENIDPTTVQFTYLTSEPITVQLTPAEVRTLLGTNNVWSDAGSVEVEYRADPTLAYNELANVIVSLGGNL